VTRNAVIGKVHRLGLSNRAGTGAVPSAGSATAPGPDHAEEPAPDTGEAPAAACAPLPDDAAEHALDRAEGSANAGPAQEDGAAPPEAVALFQGRKIIPAGQPLPPQPSANEISPEALAKVTEVEKTARRLTLMELTEKTCKWPIGDPATPNFWFCGLPVQPGKPYCEAHVGVAYQPMSTRRDRRR
jgi:GcrA cell cycle regulator